MEDDILSSRQLPTTLAGWNFKCLWILRKKNHPQRKKREDSIAVRFQTDADGVSPGGRIDDAVRLILDKQLDPSEFPSLRVVEHEGVLWSLDNRRLWVLRKANVCEICVRLVELWRQPQRFAELKAAFRGDRTLLSAMSGEDFFPRVRGKCVLYFDTRTLHHGKQKKSKAVPLPEVKPSAADWLAGWFERVLRQSFGDGCCGD